jgi:hypothetical protein
MARSIETTFPNITLWVQERGTVEIGYDPNRDSFIRAIDEGGMVWRGMSHYEKLDDALKELEAGLGQILVAKAFGVEHSARRKRTIPKRSSVRRRAGRPEDPLTRQVKKLDAIVEALRRKESVEVTRLTVVKKLCENPKAAGSFAMFLARKGQQRLREKKGKERYLQLANRAVKELKAHLVHPTEDCEKRRRSLLLEIQAEQNEHVSMKWHTVRNIRNFDLLIVEEALRSIVRPHEAQHWLYQAARNYVGGSNVLGRGAVPLIESLARFWQRYIRRTGAITEEQSGDHLR